MKYSKYSLYQKSNKKIVTDWAFKEGVFKTPQGKYIARILDHRGYVTLSAHSTEKEAINVYDNFYLTTNASNEDENPAFLVAAVSCRIIHGCFDCPFNYEYDMAIGYGCKLDTENRSIRQSKKYQPMTPDWCPAKNGSVVVKYGC